MEAQCHIIHRNNLFWPAITYEDEPYMDCIELDPCQTLIEAIDYLFNYLLGI